MQDDRQRPPRDGERPSAPAHPAPTEAPDGSGELDRLPPPAFPPGTRRAPRRDDRRPVAGNEHRSSHAARSDGSGVPADAFISPDEPIVREGFRFPADAIISPDEPIVRAPDGGFGPDDGVVTGIGDDPHLDEEGRGVPPRDEDPTVAELVAQVGRLADALRSKGEAGLRTTPDMSRFEATMRAYCVGYLAAQREAGKG